MKCWSRGEGRWSHKMERMQEKASRWYGQHGSSGNSAFDEYREETLRRLEEEKKIPVLDVYVDSPMACDVTPLYPFGFGLSY